MSEGGTLAGMFRSLFEANKFLKLPDPYMFPSSSIALMSPKVPVKCGKLFYPFMACSYLPLCLWMMVTTINCVMPCPTQRE